MNKNGGMTMTWILAIFLVFILGVVYMTMSKPWEMVSNKMTPELTGDTLASATKVNSMWNLWPVALIFVVVVAALIKTLGGQSDTGFM